MQKYTIRDLTTGQLFVVDAAPTSQAEALSEPGSPAKEGVVLACVGLPEAYSILATRAAFTSSEVTCF